MQRMDSDYTLGVWNISTIAYVNYTETDVYVPEIILHDFHRSKV